MVEILVVSFLILFVLYLLWANRVLRARLRVRTEKLSTLQNNYNLAFVAGKKEAYKEMKGDISDTIRRVKDEGSPDV